MERINVTRTFLPPFDEFTSILKRAWDKAWITNNGELVLELEEKIAQYLGLEHFLFCSNGTIVLQLALKALDIKKEVITTPFSYVATTNAILWEGCTPVFVDIRRDNFCIDETKIEAAITENTQAILATHVYGYPCNVEAIERIALKYNLKVIYDAAHAFGARYKGKSLIEFGDISTCSFHATKLFQTAEGGGITARNPDIQKKLLLYRSFGHLGDDYFSVGINAKNSELHAAMGLAVLPYVDELVRKRKEVYECYHAEIRDDVRFSLPEMMDYEPNYSYYPILFDSEETVLKVQQGLNAAGVNTRRYFYPSLNLTPQIENDQPCPISEDIAKRILCLPMYAQLELETVRFIAKTINEIVA